MQLINFRHVINTQTSEPYMQIGATRESNKDSVVLISKLTRLKWTEDGYTPSRLVHLKR